MKEICALYKTEEPLRESHIYPKFSIKHNSKTGSKYLRNFEKPNKRLQDGIKFKLLGAKAEQEFGNREKWFAENIFRKYIKKKGNLEYNENLYYFIVSFLWRIIHLELYSNKDFDNRWFYDLIKSAESDWRSFLVNPKIKNKYNKVYLLLTDRVINPPEHLKQVDFYLTRCFDATIISNENQSFVAVYGKFNRFIMFSILKNEGHQEELSDLKIVNGQGILKIPQDCFCYPFNSFITNRIEGLNKFDSPNEKQMEKIEKEVLSNLDNFIESDSYESINNEYKKGSC